ncbi:hypothetical protein M885DRAFT_626459 [Pelagophyceae sp. CCMP2097]|nr:hypothetical protein M885DRAFT_626459 [Pelagophyceae sp. CCMP2097]
MMRSVVARDSEKSGMMSLVGGYDSDASQSDDEPAAAVPPPRPAAPESKGARKGKRVLAAAALLPPEIRAALEGLAAGDDDEDDVAYARSVTSGGARPRPAGTAGQHGLLAMLPAAAHSAPAPEPADEPADEAADEAAAAGGDDSDDSDDGAGPARRGVGAFFSLPSRQPRAPGAAPPPLKIDAAPVRAAPRPRAAPAVAAWRDPDVFVEPAATTAKRTQRQLERALVTGDVAGLGGLAAAGVQIFDHSQRVDSRSAAELLRASERKPEVKIKASFYNPATGADAQSAGASKTQKRKHQINTLAVAAAEREIELLDKRGAQSQTKRQTQAKYGW